MLFLLWLVFWLICGVFSAVVAGAKKRSAFGWGVIGFLFGPLALLAVGFMPSLAEPDRDPVQAGSRRPCPKCAEPIRWEASVCPFCRSEVGAAEPPKPVLRSGSSLPDILPIAGGAVILVAIIASFAGSESPKDSLGRALADCDQAAAREQLRRATDSGLVLQRTDNGFSADERLWRQLSYAQKIGLAQAVACEKDVGLSNPDRFISIRASNGSTVLTSGFPYGGPFEDKS